MIARLIALAGIILACYGTWQTVRANNLKVEAAANEIELRACGARLSNLIEDIESDAQASNLIDNLDAVPSHWLRPVD